LCELHLFVGYLYEKKGEAKKAIKYLEKNKKFLIDDVRKNELLARLYFKNNQAPKALACIEFLLNLNSMNVSYFELALKYQGINVTKPEDAEKMVAALEVYEEKFNKSSTPVRVAINHLSASSPDFKRKLV